MKKDWIVAFAAGLIFAIGLGVAGMTDPAKVLGFLDFTGKWDPSLAFVMGGALAVHTVLRRFVLKREKPLCAPSFQLPAAKRIDGRLVAGAALFGIGWGLLGWCPGPALVSAATLDFTVVLFVGAMLVGMKLFCVVHRA